MKLTKEQRKQQTLFAQKVEPILDQLVDACHKYNMPMLVAVHLFDFADSSSRISAQSVETEEMNEALSLCSSILRGEVKVSTFDNDSYFLEPSEPSEEAEKVGVLDAASSEETTKSNISKSVKSKKPTKPAKVSPLTELQRKIYETLEDEDLSIFFPDNPRIH